ncbi:MAG: tyrosine-type recombinase/integrase, partial [Flavisolibacter sp.]
MQTAHPVIQSFIDYLKFEKRYSRHTITAYENDLITFFDYLETAYDSIPLNQITHIYVRSWLASLKEEELVSKSINRKISSLKSFFKYQLKVGAIKQTPMAKIISPKNDKRLPSFVAGKDMETLFMHVTFPDSFQGRTERLILMLFYFTGMRLSELIGLKDNQINFSGSSLKVFGKGNKERIIPANADLLKEIKLYQQEKKKLELAESGHLIVNEKGKPFNPRVIYSIVKKYLSLITTIEKKSPHVLRHTFATHLT